MFIGTFGPLEKKLYRQSVDKSRKERLDAQKRAEMAVMEQKAQEAQQAVRLKFSERKRRKLLKRWEQRWTAKEEAPPKEQLNSLASADGLRVTGREIMKTVADAYGAPVTDLISAGRTVTMVLMRDEAIYSVAKHCEDLSLTNIGRLFCRDHTSIRSSIIRYVRRNGLPPLRGLG